MPVPSLLRLFARGLNSAGVPYMVTGSVAAIVYGEPRMTNDVDIVIELQRGDIDRFIAEFPPAEYYCPPAEVIGVEIARERRGHFVVIHYQSGLKADIYLSGDDPLHAWGIANTNNIEIDEDVIPMAPAEYVIVRKLEHYMEGGSEKHLRDIRSILKASSETLHHHGLERLVHERGLEAPWGEVISEPC